MGHATAIELAEQVVESLGEDGDLDLLERDRDDPPAVAGLQEERPIARITDRAGDEALGRIEDVAASRHVLTLYRFSPTAGCTASGGSGDVDRDRVPAASAIRRGR